MNNPKKHPQPENEPSNFKYSTKGYTVVSSMKTPTKNWSTEEVPDSQPEVEEVATDELITQLIQLGKLPLKESILFTSRLAASRLESQQEENASLQAKVDELQKPSRCSHIWHEMNGIFVNGPHVVSECPRCKVNWKDARND